MPTSFASFALLMAAGLLATLAIPIIPPFIAGLCGFGRRFAYIYLPVLAAYLALSLAVSLVFIQDLKPGFPWTWASRPVISLVIVDTSLTELVKAVVAYFCGWGLRAFSRRIVRYVRSSRRPVRRERPHPGAQTFGENMTYGRPRQSSRGAFADRALAENAERESRQAERRLPPARQDLYLARPPKPRPPGRG